MLTRKFIAIGLLITPLISVAIEPGETEVTSTRESGYSINTGIVNVHDKAIVVERTVVPSPSPARIEILPPEANLFDVIHARYQLERARGNIGP